MNTRFTVGELVEDPSLDTRVMSGARGLSRAVLWAHSCEKSDPARWLGPHELLMTVGLCIPEGGEAQRVLVAELDQAGVAGIAIGDDGLAPHLTDAFHAEADSRAFPVLFSGPHTPFAAIGRTVAAANTDRQAMSVLLLAKLYRLTGDRTDGDRRAARDIGDLLGIPVAVRDEKSGCVIIGEDLPPADRTQEYPLRTHHPARLIVDRRTPIDSFVLGHLTQILTVDANTVMQQLEQRLRSGAELLEQTLGGFVGAGDRLLALWGRPLPDFRVLAIPASEARSIGLSLALAELPFAMIHHRRTSHVVIPPSNYIDAASIVGELSPATGVSSERRSFADLAAAGEEADAEYLEAAARGQAWREYGPQKISLLSRSGTESDRVISEVLGPLAVDDAQHRILRETLFAFLDHDLGWKPTAASLNLHRQSLVYRIRKIEALTGRSVRVTRDISAFWLARTAWAARGERPGP
ncbi:PucR family transcriptional regulator ligand-binding domain-containing protein [Rothia sp. AR01]|uniref:PucR family transcriptional regulator ligand-binding domain-containing protein n=1 Tax=Rothia santali TaxID=2949643 RepID=A0A9X2HH05_9MICC|nr:PucR family transcriptional regulator [Rothia santali]MCP3427189.1 PucR family transcriptional regulator ligand-binding domain-containing protein [Rothia santali]